MTGNTDLEVKFAPKQREMLHKFCLSLKSSWEPGSLVPGEYSTLTDTNTDADTNTNINTNIESTHCASPTTFVVLV